LAFLKGLKTRCRCRWWFGSGFGSGGDGEGDVDDDVDSRTWKQKTILKHTRRVKHRHLWMNNTSTLSEKYRLLLNLDDG
jgi:hypothetical protein